MEYVRQPLEIWVYWLWKAKPFSTLPKAKGVDILPLSLIGKTPASDSGFRGSSPRGAAKSRSIMDGTIYQSLKKVGRRIRSVHRLKSGAMRTADLRCNNTLLRFAVNRNKNRIVLRRPEVRAIGI